MLQTTGKGRPFYPPRVPRRKWQHQPPLPRIQDTIADVFILETLNHSDEKADRFEGEALQRMLRLSGKNPKYHYFQDEVELPHFVNLFRQSGYRYLHLSCHGSSNEIFTTNGSLTYRRFAEIFDSHLVLRRLFVSACEVGNDLFSEILAARNKGMHSIVAPVQKIQFNHAAALWNALYVSLFTTNDRAMKHSIIRERLIALRALFPVDLHFSAYRPKRNCWTHEVITATTKVIEPSWNQAPHARVTLPVKPQPLA